MIIGYFGMKSLTPIINFGKISLKPRKSMDIYILILKINFKLIEFTEVLMAKINITVLIQ